ncbi:hypothetical protein [Brevundimonas sp. FT23028]
MTQLRLFFWWVRQYALIVSHILEPSARQRNNIFAAMLKHADRKPSGQRP